MFDTIFKLSVNPVSPVVSNVAFLKLKIVLSSSVKVILDVKFNVLPVNVPSKLNAIAFLVKVMSPEEVTSEFLLNIPTPSSPTNILPVFVKVASSTYAPILFLADVKSIVPSFVTFALALVARLKSFFAYIP